MLVGPVQTARRRRVRSRCRAMRSVSYLVADWMTSCQETRPRIRAAAILRMDVERYRQAPTEADLVFFDRAIPEALCMLNDLGLLSMAEAGQSILDYPYFRQVFVAPPWEEIYTTDNERDQRFADSARVHRRASEWYRALGFELIQLPRVSIELRSEFVLQQLRVS